MSIDWELWSKVGSAAGGLGGIAGVAALLISLRANAHAKTANRIASEALEHQKIQSEVRFRIEMRPMSEQTLHAEGRLEERRWLEVDVINDGVEAEIADAGFRKKGWVGLIRPRAYRPHLDGPCRVRQNAKVTFKFGDDLAKRGHRSLVDAFAQVEEFVVRTSCKREFIGASALMEEYKSRLAELANEDHWNADGSPRVP